MQPMGARFRSKRTEYQRRPAFTSGEGIADHLIFFRLNFASATGYGAYNGPEAPIRGLLAVGFTGTQRVPLSKMLAADAFVAPANRLLRQDRAASSSFSSGFIASGPTAPFADIGIAPGTRPSAGTYGAPAALSSNAAPLWISATGPIADTDVTATGSASEQAVRPPSRISSTRCARRRSAGR